MFRVKKGYYKEVGNSYILTIEALHWGKETWQWNLNVNNKWICGYHYKTKKEAEKQARKHLKFLLIKEG